LAWCEEYIPDVILVDYMMPEMDGLEFIRHVRGDSRLSETPVIMITSADDKQTLHTALQLRATDFLRKPVDPVELIARTQNMLELRRRHRELSIVNERLKRIANTDALTGLRSRRCFLAALEKAVSQNDPRVDGCCLVLVDIDHFKSVNDRYGHDVGDTVLKHFSRVLADGTRKSDVVGRVGGEEFGILMAANLIDAQRSCSRLLHSIAGQPLQLGEQILHVTASLGLAEYGDGSETLNDFMKRCDDALYLAKANGRNRLEQAVPFASKTALATGASA
jgi:two-component system cell cycle response regulator